MGGGFMFAAASSAANPPFSAARSLPTGSQPYRLSEKDSSNFGPVPSRLEVETAILELQRFTSGLTTCKSVVDGHHHSQMLQSSGFTKFSEAFAKMLAEPPLQNLVISISCDKNVWEAILSNEAVQDLQGSGTWKDLSADLSNASDQVEKGVRNDDEMVELLWRWILSFTKAKILQLVDKFLAMLDEIFGPSPKEMSPTPSPSPDVFDEKIRSSLLLSIVILLVVVVARGRSTLN